MKIFFAFRSGYEKASKYIKEFEADSVLDWFQSNWDAFQGEYGCEENVLGVHVYGFPIEDEDLEEGQKVPAPKSLAQLKSKIDEYIYSNEIKTSVNCIQVLTDDDEIELAWYVFDEIFKDKYPEKVAIWDNEYLPHEYGEIGQLLKGTYVEILPKDKDKGCVYYGSSSIYDGANFEYLEGLYKIENIRLPSFLNYLRNNEINLKKDNEDSCGFNELLFFQFVAKQLPNSDFQEILEYLGKIPLTEFNTIGIEAINDYTLAEVLELEKAENNLPKNSFIKVSKHCCEWNTVTLCPLNDELVDTFHNYFVLFDDLWVEKNELLAKNLAQFTKTWEL